MLKFIIRNKYKLMAFMVFLYTGVDVVLHKGLTRVLFPKTFPTYDIEKSFPKNTNVLSNPNKEWKIAVNTKERLGSLPVGTSGFECDVYFDTVKNIFDVHHDEDNSIGLNLDSLLAQYRGRSMKASIWIDFKNLEEANSKPAIAELSRLRDAYGLGGKFMVESRNAVPLSTFSDAGFFTSFYTPLFNPYQISDVETKQWVDSVKAEIIRSKASAISGYYFQYPFLHHYFPDYPLNTWASNDRLSLVNLLFRRKIARSKEIFIVLYP